MWFQKKNFHSGEWKADCTFHVISCLNVTEQWPLCICFVKHLLELSLRLDSAKNVVSECITKMTTKYKKHP